MLKQLVDGLCFRFGTCNGRRWSDHLQFSFAVVPSDENLLGVALAHVEGNSLIAALVEEELLLLLLLLLRGLVFI